MKKLFVAMIIILLATSAINAETVFIESGVNMDNYWKKNGKDAEKVVNVARVIIHANELKRVPVHVYRSLNSVNATTNPYTKLVHVHTGILPYIDNDDELAFVVGHEIAHAQEAYGGALKITAMNFNSKKYEYKADLRAIDYMVKAGYNPIAAIMVGDKIFGEPLWDWGFAYSHPKGSKRLLAIYKYIYKKYPAYLNSDMAKSAIFVDFLKENAKEISAFKQRQREKANRLAL